MALGQLAEACFHGVQRPIRDTMAPLTVSMHKGVNECCAEQADARGTPLQRQKATEPGLPSGRSRKAIAEQPRGNLQQNRT